MNCTFCKQPGDRAENSILNWIIFEEKFSRILKFQSRRPQTAMNSSFWFYFYDWWKNKIGFACPDLVSSHCCQSYIDLSQKNRQKKGANTARRLSERSVIQFCALALSTSFSYSRTAHALVKIGLRPRARVMFPRFSKMEFRCEVSQHFCHLL